MPGYHLHHWDTNKQQFGAWRPSSGQGKGRVKKPPEEIPDVCPGCNIDPDQNISTPLKFSFHELANLKALLVQSFSYQKMSQLPIEGNLRIAMAAKSHEFKMRVEHVLTKGSAPGKSGSIE